MCGGSTSPTYGAMFVDGADLGAMLAAWGSSDPAADINLDGIVWNETKGGES